MRHVTGCIILLTISGLAGFGCNNDNFSNQGVITDGNRFALIIEPSPAGADPTRFLIDTATGDLWKLIVAESGLQWTRIATGPADARPIDLETLLGAKVGQESGHSGTERPALITPIGSSSGGPS